MAITKLNVNVTSTDFGKVRVGTTQDIQVELQNESSPSAAITGEVGSASSPFSVVSGGTTFELLANEDTHLFTVRFSPTAAGLASATQNITHDAPTPGSPIQLSWSGEGVEVTLTADESTLTFPRTKLGVTNTLTLTLSNDNGAGEQLTVTDVAVGSPFALASSAPALPWVINDGGTLEIDVEYTPLESGSHTDSISFTHDGDTGSPLSVDLEGECASYVKFDLPTIENTAAGDVRIELYVDPRIIDAEPDFAVPSRVNITNIGESTEIVDLEGGVTDIESLDIEIADDYTSDSNGFWFNLLEKYPDYDIQFRLFIDEDGVESHFFSGPVYRENVVWSEPYLGTYGYVRDVKVRLVSLLGFLAQTPTADVITEIKKHTQYSGAADYGYYVEMRDVFASILYAGIARHFGQAYDADAVSERNYVMRFLMPDDTVSTPLETHLRVSDTAAKNDASDFRGFIYGVTAPGNPHHWAYQFENAQELLSALCKSFGFVARYFYGQADGTYAGDGSDKHRIELLTRGLSYAGYVQMDGSIEESKQVFLAPQTAIRVSDVHTETDAVRWSVGTVSYTEGDVYVNGVGTSFTTDTATGKTLHDMSHNEVVGTIQSIISDTVIELTETAKKTRTGSKYMAQDGTYSVYYDPTAGVAWKSANGQFSRDTVFVDSIVDGVPSIQPPDGTEFDIDIVTQFCLAPRTVEEELVGYPYRALFNFDGYLVGDDPWLTRVQYYDFESSSWVESKSYVHALLMCNLQRFSSGSRAYERVYGSIRATDGSSSHHNLRPMVRVQINDGLSTKSYYAKEVRKNVMENTAFVRWARETND